MGFVVNSLRENTARELLKINTIDDILNIRVDSEDQLDSLVLAHLFAKYVALKTISSTEFSDDEFDFYEKPRDMIDYITNKEPKLKADIDKIRGIERNNYFWTVKSQSLEITKQVQNALVKSIDSGETFHRFKIRLEDLKVFKEIDVRYWKSAYQMNIAIAQSRGNWQAMLEAQPYGNNYAKYSAITDARVTENCRSLHGTVMLLDEWRDSMLVPPIHYGCRSKLIQLNDSKVEDENGNIRKGIRTPSKAIINEAKTDDKFGNVAINYEREMKKIVATKEEKVYNKHKEIKKKINIEKENYIIIENKGNSDHSFFINDKNYKEWKDSLKPLDKHIIYNYTREGYIFMNGILRNGIEETIKQHLLKNPDSYKTPGFSNLIKNYKRDVDRLIEILGKYTTESSFKLFRGMKHMMSNNDTPYPTLKVGDITTIDKGFTSTTTNIEVTAGFVNSTYNDNVILEINIPKGKNVGAYIGEYSNYSYEKEFLLKPNTKFKVLKISKEYINEDNYYTKFELEVID